MNNIINNSDIPMGFSMALSKNLDAMSYFSSIPSEKQQEIINGTHSIRSKKEMSEYVKNIKNL